MPAEDDGELSHLSDQLADYAKRSGLDPEMFNTEVHEIVCSRCGDSPQLVVLDKNTGVVIQCGCDGPRHSLDSMPYEYTTEYLPDSWEVPSRD